jgi:hypothetical protein
MTGVMLLDGAVVALISFDNAAEAEVVEESGFMTDGSFLLFAAGEKSNETCTPRFATTELSNDVCGKINPVKSGMANNP